MKCYFALSDDVSNNETYYAMFLCTLESAKKNTSLELHCLYDFRKTYTNFIQNDRIYKLLKEYGVIIHEISIDFEKSLFNIYTDDYLAKIGVTKNSLYSRFLRFMIADVEKTDEFVLYADTDVIFIKDITLDLFNEFPKTVAVCPEFDNTYKYQNFNAGIMLLNMTSYREAKNILIRMLNSKVYAKDECCDQGYLNTIYEKKFEKLDNRFNWKPYWGIDKNAYIVHLHGLKPSVNENVDNHFIPFVSELLKKNKFAKEGWFYYFDLFCKYAIKVCNRQEVLTNLLITLSVQHPESRTIFGKIKYKLFHKL